MRKFIAILFLTMVGFSVGILAGNEETVLNWADKAAKEFGTEVVSKVTRESSDKVVETIETDSESDDEVFDDEYALYKNSRKKDYERKLYYRQKKYLKKLKSKGRGHETFVRDENENAIIDDSGEQQPAQPSKSEVRNAKHQQNLVKHAKPRSYKKEPMRPLKSSREECMKSKKYLRKKRREREIKAQVTALSECYPSLPMEACAYVCKFLLQQTGSERVR